MKKLICYNCGWWDDEEEFYWQGKDIDDFGWNCPNCGKDDGWLSEAVDCEVCGDWFGEWETFGGVCRDCLWNYVVPERQDIVLGFIMENKDCFGEYAAEIIKREYAIRDKKETAQSSQL